MPMSLARSGSVSATSKGASSVLLLAAISEDLADEGARATHASLLLVEGRGTVGVGARLWGIVGGDVGVSGWSVA